MAATNVFKKAVEACKGLHEGYHPGLQALGKDSTYIRVGKHVDITGSVDIDSCLIALYPTASRWDYAIGYGNEAFFLEIHPADTGNVDEMIKKVTWLKQWLKTDGAALNQIHKCGVFYWIPSGRVKILKNSPQHRKIAQNNLRIIKLNLG